MEKNQYPPYDAFEKNEINVKEVKKRRKNKCIHSTAYYLQILLSNVGICALLIGYTLLGSFIFLMIEGRSAQGSSSLRSRSNRSSSSSLEWKQTTEDSRTKTVENIWEITAALNILYRENWTRLAAQEMSRFQDELLQKVTEEMIASNPNPKSGFLEKNYQMEWNFSRAFLYSLTILATIGYGGFSPKSSLGKLVTMGYAVVGIPLMLLYLSSVGSVLSRCARGVCSRTLCCCLCSNCGYCCYDENRMQEKEKRMKRKRELEELQQRQLQEPFYVRSSSSMSGFPGGGGACGNPGPGFFEMKELEEDWNLKSTGSILAPLGLCLMMMLTYIIIGSIILIKLESWPFLDCCYFCFMSLSTINLTDVVVVKKNIQNMTIWLCSAYILTGLALTAMCFNILHEELLKRLKKQLINGLNIKKELGLKKNAIIVADETGPDLYSSS